MGDDNILSGNSFLWLLVIVIIIVAIVIFVLSRRDDKEPKDVQDQNDRNLLPWVVGVGAVALVIGLAWYYGLFSGEGAKASTAVAAASASRIASTRNMSPQQVNQERLAQSAARSASASPNPRSPIKSASASSRSPPRGSLSVRSSSAPQ
jgi:small-conductance mechanosensitive channel